MKNYVAALFAVLWASVAPLAFAAPATLVQSVTHNGETITLNLTRENLRGGHFELWAQNATGAYDVITAPTLVDERSYLGTVTEYPDAIASGILQDDGQFRGAVYFDRGESWFTLNTAVQYTRGIGQPGSFGVPGHTTTSGQAGTTMYGFDVGIDADYDYYNVRAGSSVAKAFELIEFSVAATRAMYMHDALLRPYLGRVIIRTDQLQDPANGLTGGTYLDAVRTEWNNNHVSADRDVVAGISTGDVGGGLAWVGVIGTNSAYSVNDSGGDGEFTIVWRHELGHNWSLGHYDGGAPEGSTINSNNAYARMSGPEANKALNHRDGRLGILDNEGTYTAVHLPPYASIDSAVYVQTIDSALVIDVLANDHDANGHTLSLSFFDVTTAKGGAVIQQGQDLVYTAPGSLVGTDWFYYEVVDSSLQTATGVVAISVQPNDSLRLYLPLDETAGTDGDDSSVFDNTGTLGGTDFATVTGPGVFGNAPTFDGTDDSVSVPGVQLNSNTVTLTAWIKPGVTQNPWAGIIFDRSGGAAALNIGNTTELRYHWNDDPGTYNWNSPLPAPAAGTWTFVALVVEPTQATIYMNSGAGFTSATNVRAHAPAYFSTTYIGRDPNSGSRYFNGAIDEPRIYNYAMTQAQLLDIMDGGGAEGPTPLDGATGVTSRRLSWSPGADATSNRVYLGTSQAAVAAATTGSPEYQGSTTESSHLASLADATTYYWRVDTVTPTTTLAGTVWSFTTGTVKIGDTILVNFEENTNQTFAGGQLIGPTFEDSSNWNSVFAISGSQLDLDDNAGDPTGVNLVWSSSTVWYNNDGLSDDEHKLAVGYLDDGDIGGGNGATVTLSNIPYATYKVYGLFATDQNQGGGGSTATINFNVNGTWALGGNAGTTAAAWGTIEANNAAHGSYWTEIVLGSVQGNYWTVDTSGSTCTIVGEPRNGTTRGTLSAVIIEDTTPTNAPPTWTTSPVNEINAIEGVAYPSTLDDDATDPDGDPRTFAYVSGPTWLNVASNGALTGAPGPGDVGPNSWRVSVSDSIAAPVEVTLNITVLADNDGDGLPDLADPDDDNDEMPDSWELAHGLDPFTDDRTGNPDNDSYDNWNEYIADTLPQDANSQLGVVVDFDPGTGDSTVRFDSSAARNYLVEYSSDLTPGNWNDLALVEPGTGSEMSVVDTAGAPKRFYRLRVSLP